MIRESEPSWRDRALAELKRIGSRQSLALVRELEPDYVPSPLIFEGPNGPYTVSPDDYEVEGGTVRRRWRPNAPAPAPPEAAPRLFRNRPS